MNPALRTLPATALLVGPALLAGPGAHADDGGLAGTRAGEGRAHPGRADTPSPSPSDDDPPGGGHDQDEGAGRLPLIPGWTPSSLPVPGKPDRQQAQRLPRSEQVYGSQRTGTGPSDRAMRVLPLGTGLALTGLGLGLAFLGLRLRRR
ncbi:hypothetical protein [Streptomyces sp. NPDC005322]|uniref:hypothetical protein n=1 Tax=Streptomyces sp. NPDC005322 TaxID=3157032 RepID=UPI0033B818DA